MRIFSNNLVSPLFFIISAIVTLTFPVRTLAAHASGTTSDDMPKNSANAVNINMNFYFSTHKRLSYRVEVCNTGTNDLKSVTIRTMIDGSVTDKSFSINPALKTGETSVLAVNNVMNVPGLHTLSSAVCKANGVLLSDPEYISTEYGSYDYGYPRAVVVEQQSSANCGICPAGIVSMNFFKNRYPDWICVAVHDDDAMQTDSYDEMSDRYWGGHGSHKALVNRVSDIEMIGEDPDDEYYGDINKKVISTPAFVAVFADAECDADARNVIVNGMVEMACEGKTPLALSFAVVEDGVGPFTQKNDYASYPEVQMGGWENMSSSEEIYFNNVARRLDGFPGIDDSLPQEFEAYVPYEFNRVISLDGVDSDLFRIVAMVINTSTGEIMNATQTLVSKSGVDNIYGTGNNRIWVENGAVCSTDPSLQVISLDGRIMVNHNLASGMYIAVSNGLARKIFVK